MRYIGFLLLVLGFFLISIGIGVPIFVAGLLLLIFDFYKTWINRLVPKEIREKVGAEIKESYVPYQPAIKSLKSAGKQMLKISLIAFVIILVIFIGIYVYVESSREKPCAGCMKAKNQPTTSVPLPQKEDIIRSFFGQIDEQKPSEAVLMMSESITSNDSLKQARAVEFNAISSMKVIKFEPTSEVNVYKVTLSVQLKPGAKLDDWNDGENIRWVTLAEENGLWKIKDIATRM